jgi:hypothetical protein
LQQVHISFKIIIYDLLKNKLLFSETGQCFCSAGWQGLQCDRPCDENRFGKDCSKSCNCSNHGACEPSNGMPENV